MKNITVRTPFVDATWTRQMADNQVAAEFHVAYDEVNLMDPTTGVIIYTTPIVDGNRQSAMHRASHWARRNSIDILIPVSALEVK